METLASGEPMAERRHRAALFWNLIWRLDRNPRNILRDATNRTNVSNNEKIIQNTSSKRTFCISNTNIDILTFACLGKACAGSNVASALAPFSYFRPLETFFFNPGFATNLISIFDVKPASN
tara:strand:+ start:665 stop:1030 length:366 start_codon:yes stop_codon:yes gene_type:complete